MNKNNTIGIGIALGISFGTVVAIIFKQNMGLFSGIGMLVGITVANIISSKNQ